jgi:hypothetical protein
MRIRSIVIKSLALIVSGLSVATFGQSAADTKVRADIKAAGRSEAARGTFRNYDRSKPVRPEVVRQSTADFRQEIKADLKEQQSQVREEVTSKAPAVGIIRHEVKDAVNEAREQAHEHGRKLAEEAKEAANSHRRD